MSKFTIANLQDSSILALNEMKDSILIDPDYQREGGVWSRSKKQLFIDSLLNKYDVPKFYFHTLTGDYVDEKHIYSIIDGRQRLESIWEFLAGDFALSKDIVYQEDPSIDIRNMKYSEMARLHPRLGTRLNARSLTVMVVSTDDIDCVEDMFTRLNEAVPLNAAEKRNSFGGELPKITRRLVEHSLFKTRIPIRPSRYRHHDLAAKILYVDDWLTEHDEVADTKKASIDDFFRRNSKRDPSEFQGLDKRVTDNLGILSEIFIANDPLLRSSGMLPVYYLLVACRQNENVAGKIDRSVLAAFEDVRAKNREMFANEEEGVDFKLIEYDELAQSSNDAAAIAARLNTLREYASL